MRMRWPYVKVKSFTATPDMTLARSFRVAMPMLIGTLMDNVPLVVVTTIKLMTLVSDTCKQEPSRTLQSLPNV